MKKSMKRIVSMLVLISLFCSSVGYAFTYPTDSKGHWAESKIQKYLDSGIIVGYEDGLFKPDNFVTRAEFVTILNRYFKFENIADIGFTDIPKDVWYKLQIEKAIGEGYILGYNDNSFRPNEFITRQEAAVIIAKLLKLEITTADSEGNNLSEFLDSGNIPSWSKGSLNVLIRHSLLNGYPTKTVGYQKYLTRAELLTLLENVENHMESVKETVPEIKSITVDNGKITIKLTNTSESLSKDDFEIKATLNGKSYDLENLKFDADKITFTFDEISKTSKVQKLEITVSSGSEDLEGSKSYIVEIPKKSSSSGSSDGVTNTAPSKPVITRTPSGNVSTDEPITITAVSTDAEGDTITYVWNGKLPDGSTYPLGKNVVTVKAVDEHGLESEQAAIVFFAIDSTTGNGGLLLTTPNSRIYENGIEGATITGFTFNVPSVGGHSGYDKAEIRGLNVNTQKWDYIADVTGTTEFENYPISGNPVNIANGVYMQGTMDPGTYSRLEFFYYASHCMYGNSNITYTVEYEFGALDPDVSDEAAPIASNVIISGTGNIGNTLTGSYVYADANGDFEGYVDENFDVIVTSDYQWYRSDDALGTNKTPITGATNLNYTVDEDDTGKYLTFEVTPLAVTGVDGTLIGDSAESTALHITNLSSDADIITFTIPEQTATAVIDSEYHTINLEVVNGTVLTSLTPTITISPGATVSPQSLEVQDFTSPVTYTVTSEDGTTVQLWTVNVSFEEILSDETDILTFAVPEQTLNPVIIDKDSNSITVEVVFGTDVTALTPAITVSTGATISPDNLEVQDFSKPVSYTVTAEDGETFEIWTVTIVEELPV